MAGTATGALYRRSAEFWEQLEKTRRGIPDIAWYPYCSLANFEHFVPLLGGETDFASLLGSGPIVDIGCADGDLSFFLESAGLGGAAIHALDHSGTNHNQLRGIAALKAALGSGVEIHDLNLDEGFELPARPYSMAFCLGLLYHVKNPFHLLESLSRYARVCLLSTRIMRTFPGGEPVPAHPAAYLLGADQLNSDETNFWIFNEAGLRRLVARSGWELERFYSTGDGDASDPDSLVHDERAFCLLRARRWLANITLESGWHEESPEGWRWTERRFAFSFAPAAGARRLELHMHVPEAAFAQTGPVDVRATGSLRYRIERPGPHVVAIPVSPEVSRIECELSACLAPSAADPRELGVIVTEVRFS